MFVWTISLKGKYHSIWQLIFLLTGMQLRLKASVSSNYLVLKIIK